MILFSSALVQTLIVGALILTAAGALLLVGLFLVDLKNKNIW